MNVPFIVAYILLALKMQPNQTAIYEVNITGGARIGWAKASWPFAKLTVSRDKLQLNGGIIGNLVFKPTDVTSIETYSMGVAGGLKIIHNVSNYKSLVVFTTTGNSNDLLNDIRKTGFLTNADQLPAQLEQEIHEMQQGGGFPLRPLAAIIVVAIWNICLLPAFFQAFFGRRSFINLDTGINAALIFLLAFALSLFFVKPIQHIVLKPGRTVKDIRSFLIFLIILASIMLTMHSLIPMATHFKPD